MEFRHHANILKVVSPREFDVSSWCEVEQSVVTLDKFGIDEARELTTRAYQRPVYGSEQLLVVCADLITHEAQNALLKILEEPPSSTKFLFVVPPDLSILPTLASRFQVITNEDVQPAEIESSFVDFLALSYAERLAEIETRLKKGDQVWQRTMKQGLIEYVIKADDRSSMSELEYIARMLLTRGASNKMLLEQVALSLPIS